MPHSLKDKLADALQRDAETIRVIAPDVGGGFGAKAGMYAEFPVLAKLAERFNRPVTWTETRSEDMLALAHSRHKSNTAKQVLIMMANSPVCESDLSAMQERIRAWGRSSQR